MERKGRTGKCFPFSKLSNLFFYKKWVDKNVLVHFLQKKLGLRKNVFFCIVYKCKVIHM